MKLYLIKGVLIDYSSGMVCIKAYDIAEARIQFINWLEPFDEESVSLWVKEFDTAIGENNFKTFDLSDTDDNQLGVVYVIWGGS